MKFLLYFSFGFLGTYFIHYLDPNLANYFMCLIFVCFIIGSVLYGLRLIYPKSEIDFLIDLFFDNISGLGIILIASNIFLNVYLKGK